MIKNRLSQVCAPLALLFVSLASGNALADSDQQKGEAPLVRPDSPPDADAKGKLEIKSDNNRDKFKVEAKQLDTNLSFDVFLEDALGSGNLVTIGTMEVDGDGSDELQLKFESDKGPLPFNVASVADLVGRRLEVRSGVQVYLLGTVPAFGSGDSGDSKWQKGKAHLTRPASPPDDNAKGKLEIRSRTKDNRQRFSVKAERLSTGSYFVFLEDALGSGNLVNVGTMSQDGDGQDEYKLKLDTGKGDQLPFGAASVADLVGRRLEVRDGADTVYLLGEVPTLSSGGGHDGKSEGESKLTGSTGKGEVKVEANDKNGKQEFELKLKKQAQNSSVDFFLEDPATNLLALVATLTTSGSGKAKYKVKTNSGASLPFGVLSVADLAGMAIEIREPGTGTVLLSGTVPALSP